MLSSPLVLLALLAPCLTSASPTGTREERAFKTATVVVPSPSSTILGNVYSSVESFGGIPYAEPPVGPLRLRPPKRLEKSLGTFDGTGPAGACPQMVASTESKNILFDVLGSLANLPLVQNVTGQSEDCLSITVARPEGTKSDAKLPVLFWIYGGGFELGWSSMYDGSSLVNFGVDMGKPFIFVAVNYRVAGFGFMPGKEIQDDGAGNIGLLDQRMGLEWVADNIAAFGGDPDKVTIWGESAGAISVFTQLALFDGDITYKEKPLFRGAIMDSGSVVPVDSLDCAKGQAVYDEVVKTAGCDKEDHTLNCLRGLEYEKFLNAVTSVPGILSYNALALSYLPRADGRTLTESPEALVLNDKVASMPMIIGDQEDEGTLFSIFQPNVTTTDDLIQYLKDYYFSHATEAQITELVDTYGDGVSAVTEGSPFRTGLLNEIYPGFKRRAAILGDLVFTLSRRLFLAESHILHPEVPSWSYLSSYDYGTPILGTFHASDLIQVFFGIKDNYAARSVRTYYINFLYDLDPNDKNDKYPDWPQWELKGKKLLNVFGDRSQLIEDSFRNDTFTWLSDKDNLVSLRY